MNQKPYTVVKEKAGPSGLYWNHVITGPTTILKKWEDGRLAEERCAELNAAFLAGLSSGEQRDPLKEGEGLPATPSDPSALPSVGPVPGTSLQTPKPPSRIAWFGEPFRVGEVWWVNATEEPCNHYAGCRTKKLHHCLTLKEHG